MSKITPLLIGLALVGGVGIGWLARSTRVDPAPGSSATSDARSPVEGVAVVADVPSERDTPMSDVSPALVATASVPIASVDGASVGSGAATSLSETPPAEADVRRLDQAVTSYEVGSLPIVASYLNNAHPELRRAALEGMLQMGLSQAAPLLREAAEKANDPREAIAMLDAADFLDLPTLDLPQGKARVVAEPRPRPGRNARVASGSQTPPAPVSR